MNVLLLIDTLPDNHRNIFVQNILAAFSFAKHRIQVVYSGDEQEAVFRKYNVKTMYLGTGVTFSPTNKIFTKLLPARFRKLKMDTSIPAYSNLWEGAIREVMDKEQIDLIYLLSGCGFYFPGTALLRMKCPSVWMIHAETPLSQHYFLHEGTHHSMTIMQASAMRIMTFAEADYICCSSRKIFSRLHFYHTTFRRKLLYLPFSGQKIRKQYFSGDKLKLFYSGNMAATPGIFHFLNAFSQMISSLKEEDKKKIEILVCDEIDAVAEAQIRKLQLTNNIQRIPKEKCDECISQCIGLVHVENDDKESWNVSPYFPDFVSSDKPVVAITYPNSETASLLGDQYPYLASANNEDAIYFVLMEIFIAWQQNRTKGYFPQDLAYLFSFENFNSVIDMAMRCCGDKACEMDISSHKEV